MSHQKIVSLFLITFKLYNLISPNFIKSSPIKFWLGYCDSNTGMSESESDALPLGDTPNINNKILNNNITIN